MRRNKVAYDAFSDEENEKKRTVVNNLEEESEESEEMNEEEQYLREIRRERLLQKLRGEENEDEKEEEEEEKDESDHDAFDPEEVKEIEAFKQRLQQRRELERSRSQKTDFSRKYWLLDLWKEIVSFDNPEVASFLQRSSSLSSTIDSPSGSLVRVNSLKTSNSMQSRRLTLQNVGMKE